MLTRSAAKAKRFVLFFFILQGRSWVVFTRTYSLNDKLPEDVLLEIFDAYRCDMKLKPLYENSWNSRDGWFKFAHVCWHWRRVVLFSPSRLDMHLPFTLRKSSMDEKSVLRCLPQLPILLDYSATLGQPPIHEEDNLAFAAIEDRGRVRGITLRSWDLNALDEPFPGLQSLDIGHHYLTDVNLIFPAPFLSGSALGLRRLTLQGVTPHALSPLLSSATGLVELTLTVNVLYGTLPEASVFANLKRMSWLRCLKLKWGHYAPPGPITSAMLPAVPLAGDIPLLKLTDFIFTGPFPILHMLVVRMSVPSLQHLDAEICCRLPSIPPLSNCETERRFISICLSLLPWRLNFSAETTKSDYGRSFRILFPTPIVPLEQIGNMLSRALSTVEEVVIVCVAKLGKGL
jgi:hypothetical protein